MPEVVISDASCIILLDKIHELSILKNLYSYIYITEEIANECLKELPEWIIIKPVKDSKYYDFLTTFLDSGESSAIALYMETESPLLILDDLKARKYAKKMNLNITGTLGIIHKAKEKGLINEIKPIIDKITQTQFRLSDKVVYELLKINNEL